jgi:integrase
MAYNMDYTPMSRRDYGTGSLFQRCEARFGCPPLVDGDRPQHKCQGRWFGVLEAGSTANGDRRRVTVSGKTKTVVQRRLRDKRLEMERLGTTAATTKAMTVAAYSKVWLEAIETQITPSALTTDKAAVKKINTAIGSTRLRDLTAADVRKVAKSIRANGGSSSTALRYQGSLMRMLKAAMIDGHPIPPSVLLAENPSAAVNDREALTPGKYKAALAEIAARESGSRWAVAFLTGLRQREALGLTWDCVDLVNGTITVAWQLKNLKHRERGNPAAGFVVPDGYEARHLIGAQHLVRPKSKKGWRVIPLIPWAWTALAAWREIAPDNPHDLVWCGPYRRGGWWPRNEASDRAEWHTIQEAVGVAHPTGRPYGTHEIRHTTATILLDLKVPESIRMAIMGHASIEATQIYETVDRGMMMTALEGVGEMLGLPAPENDESAPPS